jgi:3-hydroxyacyl-[acyl-carrier-protein] dehydratase
MSVSQSTVDSSGSSTYSDRAAILERVRTIMRRDLKLGNDIAIDESMPFSGGDADIDSLDILLMLSSVEKEFGIKITSADMGQKIFQNVGTLVDFLATPRRGDANMATSGKAAGDILEHLPHRPPFRFVSRLTSVEDGKSAEGVWAISGAEDFFAGHFPSRPIVPGVLIAEAMAQLSGLAANIAGAEGRLAQVEVRFEIAVAPPAEIRLQSKVIRTMGTLIQYEVGAQCGSKTVAAGTITLNWSGSGGG